MWYVYLVQSERTGALYCGATTDLDRRLAQHNAGAGAKWTRAFRPVRLVWSERVGTKSEALRREAEVKRLSRRARLALAGLR